MPDVLIAGGGPAGLAAAIALAGRGVAVAVADTTGGVSARRGELLAQGAAAIVERLGLADVLTVGLAIKDVESRWGEARLQVHDIQPGLGLHGWGIDREALSRAMVRRVRALGVDVLSARVAAPRRTSAGWQVRLKNTSGTRTMRARYLIDATGRAAAIARRCGATLLNGPGLVAVTWQSAEYAPAKMLSEAAPNGWWYAVPHRGGGTLGFLTGSKRAREICRAPGGFQASARDGLKLIRIEAASQDARLMDSRSAVLDRMSGPGWLATGDAAAAFDPIASQGLFNALSGGFFAGQAAADAIAGDADAPLVYEALAARTAERTHGMTHLQYAAMPHDTPFWRARGHPGTEALRVTA
jgi:flavin-dependent dehydrogenase